MIAASATRASMDDLGSVAIALKDNLKVGEEGFEGALNMLAYAGKRGQFEIRDMAKWLPTLSPSFQALGVSGKEAVTEIGAALQIARKGAGSNDEAANNFKNFLQKITAPDTLKDFEKAGIDLKASMMNLRAQGMTPVQAMLDVITQYMGKKGPEAAGQFQKVMTIKDDKEREAALQRLSEAYKLGELFQDMQAMSFIRPAIANQGELKNIKQGSMEASDKDLLGADFKKRMDGASEQFKAFKIGMMDIGITIGDALLPPLTDMLQELKPGIKAFGDWAKQHPGVIKGVIGLVSGLLAGKMAFIGIKYGINLVLSPFNALTTSITAVSGKWTQLRAMWQAGRFAHVISGLRAVTGGVLTVGRFLLPFGQGLLMTFGAPLMLAGRGALFLGKLLAGNLVSSLRLAGQAVLWLGRALMLNPIGLAVTAIAGGAYMIYRNWDTLGPWFGRLWGGVKSFTRNAWEVLKQLFFSYTPLGLVIRHWQPISGWFRDLWAQVKNAFAGGIGGVARLILNWSPLGLFYKAFTGVMQYFGVSLPKNFSDFGGHLIDGLVNGIKAKLGAARDTIVQFGSSIKGWFSSTLGIKSPSRVFMGFGDNIAQGAAIGVARTAGMVAKATAGMALATTTAWGQPALPAPALGELPAVAQPALAAIGQSTRPVPQQRKAAPLVMPVSQLRPVTHIVRPATSHMAEHMQTVHQRMVPAAPEMPAPLLQPVTQIVRPASLKVADAVQTVWQRVKTAAQAVAQPASTPERERLAERVKEARAAAPTTGATGAATAGMHIVFSPQITLQPGTAKEVQQQVSQAVQLSFVEFERLMKRYEADKKRRSYGGNS